MRPFFLLILLLVSARAHAFRLDPMVISLPVTSPQASGAYTIENTTKARVAVQFEVRGRKLDKSGKEERPEVSGFLIYPEQMSLEPGEKRNVRVTWTGEALPPQEMAYRFVATQLPVDFAAGAGKPKDAVQLKFLIEYVASLYIVPPGAKEKFKTVSHKVNKGVLEILVRNEGSAHMLLDKMKISYKSKGREGKPDDKNLAELRTENLLPGNERLLKVNLPKDFPTENFSVDISFDP